jgi:ubiquinone/menaquinone biosynthesis C-methylase UbiE
MSQDNENSKWKESLELFFSNRANDITGDSFEEFCYVSGRDPRLWGILNLYRNLIDSIINLLDAQYDSKILEVGCATGFIAKDLHLKVQYTGVDLSQKIIKVAKRLIPNGAKFVVSDGSDLLFSDNSFDGAFCYDVFTNFPSFSEGEKIIMEMNRVVKPGKKILIGSVPDIKSKQDFLAAVQETIGKLDLNYGPPKVFKAKEGFIKRIYLSIFRRKKINVKPEIICYYFNKNDFKELGTRLGLECNIFDIDRIHPYFGFRFNVVYTKPLT